MNNLITKELYWASLFCKMSYYSPSEMKNILSDETNNTFSDIKNIVNFERYFEDTKVKCYIFKYNDTIFVTFNSVLLYTNKQQDKFKDNIYIHKGLLEQYKLIEHTVHFHINALVDAATKKLYISGYYMGGGLATIAAAILGEKYKNIYLVSCYTFASPKIGNKHFKAYFKDNVTTNYRVIVNDKIDLISNLNNYNTFNYYKHKCGLYSHFVDKEYCHVSNAFILEDNNILELPKPKFSKTEKFFMKCSKSVSPCSCTVCNLCCSNYLDELVDIDIYINRFSSIIAKYKTNLLQKQKTLITASIAAPATEYFETFAITGSSSESSSPSKTPKSADVQLDITIKHDDMKLLQERLDKILQIIDSRFCI